MYSMWKIMCFLNHEPCKRIALHQIHKIMFFLAMSYDPFKKQEGGKNLFTAMNGLYGNNGFTDLNVNVFFV